MNILIASGFDDDEKFEDMLFARVFRNDGHKVTIVDNEYDERLDDLNDLFIQRNTWMAALELNSVDRAHYDCRKRVVRKDLPRINFDGKFDGTDKMYLVNLFKEGESVIPSVDNLEDVEKLGNPEKYMLKLKDSFSGIGQSVVTKEELKEKFNSLYIIQPYLKFHSEVQFYYVNNKFEYALEFVPGKLPVCPLPIMYHYTEEELKIANKMASLNGNFYGIQRIDFIKMEDGRLLLAEIEDTAPYLDLLNIDEKTRNQFLQDYKEMVYEYCRNKGLM